VDDFYTARSSTSPPLPWSNFAPPFSIARTFPNPLLAEVFDPG